MPVLATAILVLSAALTADPAPSRAFVPVIGSPSLQETPAAQPDFEAYFPNDAEGGLALDRYFADHSNAGLGDDEYIALIRNGLRRTTVRKLFVLREFGNRFVWGNRTQRMDAIELMFHAADPRPEADAYGTRHSAIYFGLSVTQDKTPRILDAMVAVAMASESASTIGRIAWGTSQEKDEMLKRLAPHLASDDPIVREKAEDLAKIFRKEESASQRRRRRAIAKAHSEYAGEIPAIRRALREGTTPERRAALDRLRETSLIMILDREAFADFEAAATDPDASVRRDVVRTVGAEWIWSGEEQHGPSIALMLRLSEDPDPQVRYDAVYYGLSTVSESREDVVSRLLAMLLEPPNSDLYGRLRWGLRHHKDMARELLLATLEGDTKTHKEKVAAHGLYQSVIGEAPPVRVEGVMSPADLVGRWNLTLTVPGGRTGNGVLTITRDGDKFTISSEEGMQFPEARLVVTQHGANVLAGAAFEGPAEGLVATMNLRGGILEGVFMQSGERLLMPFTAARSAR